MMCLMLLPQVEASWYTTRLNSSVVEDNGRAFISFCSPTKFVHDIFCVILNKGVNLAWSAKGTSGFPPWVGSMCFL